MSHPPSTKWEEEVRSALSHLGDLKRQQLAWRSGGAIHFPDAAELYVMLMDDFKFPDFLERRIRPSDEDSYAKGLQLIHLLRSLSDEKLEDSIALLKDANWLKVTALSSSIAQRLAGSTD